MRDAEKVPGRILDVVGIDRAVRLELRAAVVVAPGVVERDAALPELRRCVGSERDDAIETGDRLLDASREEVFDRAVEDVSRIFSRSLRRR